jgi:hypothetical protein
VAHDKISIKPGTDEKFLKYLYGRYVKKHGIFRSKLNEQAFYISMTPQEFAIDVDGVTWHPIIELSSELESKGYVRYGNNESVFYLTTMGFERAQANAIDKGIEWLNKNTGVISFVAVIISIVALIAA